MEREQTERSIDKVMNKQYLMQNFTEKYHRLAQKLRGNSYKDNVNSLSVSLILTQVMSINSNCRFSEESSDSPFLKQELKRKASHGCVSVSVG
jgi:hypothetical protein